MRQVLAVAGVLEAAVRHLGDQRDMRVDPHATEVQPLLIRMARLSPRPHADASPSSTPFAHRDRFVLAGEPLHGDHRAEDLSLHDLVVLPHPATPVGATKKPRSP